MEQREILSHVLSNAKFFSLQADGTTDSGRIEDELFLVVYFDPRCDNQQVCIQNKFFSVRRPSSGSAEGLYECVKQVIKFVGVDGWEHKLVGLVVMEPM